MQHAKCICDCANAHSGHFITDWKCQIRRKTLNDHGCGIWCGQTTGHMLFFLGRRSAVKSEGQLIWSWALSESKWWLRPLNPIWLQTRCISNHTASKGLIISLLINICIWILSIHINLLVYWDHFSYFFQCFFPKISLITSLNSHSTIWHIFRYYHLTGGD